MPEASRKMILVGVGVLVFAATLAWAVLLPAAYSCPPNAETRLGRVGPNEPEIGAPGELRPLCRTSGPLSRPIWASKNDRVSLRVGLAVSGATLCAASVALARRRTGQLAHPSN